MALKTLEDAKQLLIRQPIPREQASLIDVSLRLILLVDGRPTLISFGALHNQLPFSLKNTVNRETIRKYQSKTGHNWECNEIDFFYHWLDGFSTLSTYEQLRNQITDPTTSGLFSTTLAVNKYIKENSLSITKIKALLKGSLWRWVKTETDQYIQGTLYSRNSVGDIVCLSVHSNNTIYPIFNQDPCVLSYPIPFLTWLTLVHQRELTNQQREVERRAARLLPHNTKAEHTFAFKKEKTDTHSTFLGIELELENYSQEEYKILKTIAHHALFKRDGSLSNGVEICSAPATLDVHKKDFEPFFKALKENKTKLEAKSSCGMHIHVDKKKLSTLHIANISFFLNNSSNTNQIKEIAGRSTNNYCKKIDPSYYDFTYNKSKFREERYEMLNLTNTNTIEFRIFASTTNFQDFCKRLEFTQAVVDYTRPGQTNLSCKELPHWDNFQSYITKHKYLYPTLTNKVQYEPKTR